MLYRIVETTKMDNGQRFVMGSVSTLKGVSSGTIRALIKRQRIAEVQPPPLKILPGWEERAKLLEPLGIVDVGHLVTADIEQVAKKLGVSVKGLQRAVEEARQWVDVIQEVYRG